MNYFIVAIFILLVILVIYLIFYTSKKNEKFSTKIDYLEWKKNNDSVTFKNEVSNNYNNIIVSNNNNCLLYTSPSPRDGLLSRMPSSA